MNIPPSEAKQLAMHEYEGILWNWNDAHDVNSDGDVPDAETTMVLVDRINADPRFTGPRAPARVN